MCRVHGEWSSSISHKSSLLCSHAVYAPAPLQSPATSGSSFYSPLSHGVSNPATPLSARAATPSSVGVPQGWGGQRERSRLGRDGAGGWDAAEPGGAFNEGVWANERDAQARITRGDTGEHTEMATAQSGGFGGVFAIGHGRGTMAGTGCVGGSCVASMASIRERHSTSIRPFRFLAGSSAPLEKAMKTPQAVKLRTRTSGYVPRSRSSPRAPRLAAS